MFLYLSDAIKILTYGFISKQIILVGLYPGMVTFFFWNNETNYEYDNLNQLIKVTDPINQEIEYSYTRPGNLKDITITEGTNEYTTSYGYDGLGRIQTQTITADAVSRTVSCQYDDAGMTPPA